MPIFKIKNEQFFKNWTLEMAYVLGFFCADGSMFVNPRGSHYVAFYANDRKVLEFIRSAMGAEHKISSKQAGKHGRKSPAYYLQIGSQEMFADMTKLGLVSNKAHRMILPEIPSEFIATFVRGYFDGDGNIVHAFYKRKTRPNPTRVLRVTFTSGSKNFLKSLSDLLSKTLSIKGFINFHSGAWRLIYSNRPSKNLLEFMYDGRLSHLPVLERKYERFLKLKKFSIVGP